MYLRIRHIQCPHLISITVFDYTLTMVNSLAGRLAYFYNPSVWEARDDMKAIYAN